MCFFAQQMTARKTVADGWGFAQRREVAKSSDDRLRQNLLHDVCGGFDAGEFLVESLEAECQLLVIYSQLMQDRGIQIANVHGIVFKTVGRLAAAVNDVVAVFVRLPVLNSAANSTTGQPGRETPGVMIATVH